jgi:hypothetical protein
VRAILRTLILWLVLLAVPFQGAASAAMLACAPATAATPAAAGAASAHDHHAMMAAAGAGHDHHAMMASADNGSDTGAPSDHHSGAKCGTCAVCCIGAAMAPVPRMPLQARAAQFVFLPFDVGYVPSVDLDHPERPPRSSLA